ncbi:hypothetical protein [Streptantibioticus ferralitis]|uniref:Uncharacterized protein n=1 Tax=Streptantibioticus ferralitis TaxID=236510 RepID=A0ABT5Z3E9_9ACTN|nr:hypothetical protein [Streptantibioticus ferralitis]MDF2258357.1 hypothetical protein [Streptantibioticus ferralitis]
MEIDLSQARQTVQQLLDALEELDGTEVDEAPTRAARRQQSQVTRTLLYLAHLGDRAKVEVMDAYHAFKMRDGSAGE